MKNFGVFVLFVSAFWTGLCFSADANPVEPLPSIVPPTPALIEISLEQATKQVISNNSMSRVLSAKTEEIEGRKVHAIKILTKDGHIQQQTIAADTGVLLDINNN